MKISPQATGRIIFPMAILLMLLPMTAFAQNRVVVIPLFDGACASGTCKPLKNIVTVAKANGMFTDPVAALNSITDASETNPYLAVIGPGVYTVTAPVVMKEWVDITGSGENVTKIKGAISGGTPNVSAVIKGANNSALSLLTVENTGGGSMLFNYSVALYDDNVSPTVTNVNAIAYGGTYNYGVYNGFSSATMINVTATASGGTSAHGVRNNDSSPVMTNVTATASGGTASYGVYNDASVPVLRRSVVG